MTDFDAKRFDALVLFIAYETKDDPRFGRTKLAKTLFYSDFEAYRDEGKPLTGATYIRMPRGPFPKELRSAELRLERAKCARLDYDTEEGEEKRIVPLVLPHDAEALYESWQLVHVRLWIGRIKEGSAKRISDRSHEHPGWILAKEDGVVIPYESVFAPDHMPPDEAVELGRRLAVEHPEWT
jgi:Protein of unknown function (DUF4065)